jgi:glycosyltransferase involved in cell wall biosynthesis
MRVHLINYNLIGQDAIGQCIQNQARFFRRRGDTVRIYTLWPATGVPEDIGKLVEIVTLDALLATRGNAFWSGDLYVYHFPGHYALIETMQVLERGAVILYYHNVTPPELWGNDAIAESLARSIASVRDIVRFADYVVTPSPFNAQELAEKHGADAGRTFVLHNAVPLEQFTPGVGDVALVDRYGLGGKRVILFVGRMAGNKRIDLLIEALAQVRRRVSNTDLLLVGEDQEPPRISEIVADAHSRADALGVADAVHFAGVVDDLAAHMRLADVYATASLHEGFGVPLIEAMASGIPVVASDATAHPWVVGDAGLLAKAGDADDLADKIANVLADDGLHGDLVNRGLRRAQTFSLDRYEAEWARIVSRAVAYLPRQPYPDLMSAPAHSLGTIFGGARDVAESVASPNAGAFTHLERARALLNGHILHLDNTADVMKRGYVVRSGVPVIGPLIAWVRRTLTSHLREPYLDPMIEKQVAFNRHVAFTLHQILDALTAQLAQQAKADSGSQAAPSDPSVAGRSASAREDVS